MAQHGVFSTRRTFLQAAAVGTAAVLAPAGLARAAEPAAGGEAKKKPLKFGLASYTTRKFSLDETIAMAKRVGLEYLCLKDFHLPLTASADEIRAAAEKVKEAGLILYGCGVVTMRNEADVNRAFEYAKTAGMTTIIAAPMPEVLPLVDKKVREYDLFVAIHNHGPGDKVYPTPESIIEKIAKLDGRIGLCIDIGHTVRIGADPIRDAARYADRLHDVHIKDVSAAAPEGNTLEIGRGVIDIPAFLSVLLKTGYSKVVSYEYEKDEKDPLPGLAESVGYVNGVLAALK